MIIIEKLLKAIPHFQFNFNTKHLKNEQAQTFIEFLFILLVMISLSMVMVRGFNGTIAKQWKALVQAVAMPNDANDFDL